MTLAPPSVVFDCDGVILQSNTLKSDCFALVLEGHDPALVADFVAWHKATGGVSRFYKFARFFRETLQEPAWEMRTAEACGAFGEIVSQQLRTCPTIPGFEPLVEGLRARGIRLAVNTGGAQEEVRAVFADRGIADAFGMILGSPTTKRENMAILRNEGYVLPGSVYLGDAELDLQLAEEFGFRFVYVEHESEWKAGAGAARAAGGVAVKDLTALLPEGLHPL